MKITSITLTSEYEIKNSDPKVWYPDAKHTPVYQVEYEETTPTGLKATGTKILDSDGAEKAVEFFKNLEIELLKEHGVEESNEDKPFNINYFFEILNNSEPDVEKVAEQLMKAVNERLRNNKGIR